MYLHINYRAAAYVRERARTSRVAGAWDKNGVREHRQVGICAFLLHLPYPLTRGIDPSETAKQILNSDQGAEVDEGAHIPTYTGLRDNVDANGRSQQSGSTCSSTTRSCARARPTTQRRRRCSCTLARVGRSRPSSSRRIPCVFHLPSYWFYVR